MQYLFHSIYYSTNDSRAKSTEATAAAAKPSTPLQVRYEDHAWNASYGGRKVWSYILEPEMPKGPVPIVPVSKQQGKKKQDKKMAGSRILGPIQSLIQIEVVSTPLPQPLWGRDLAGCGIKSN